jgi:hypothetical protein
MQRICRSVLIVLAVLCSSVATRAAENPLKAIPDDAGVIIRWQKPTETVKKAVAFVSKVDPVAGQLLGILSDRIGVAISNPELAGLDKQRDWYVAVFPKAEGDPGIVFAIPTTDADAMQAAIDGEFNFAKYEDWLLYAQDETLIEKIQTQIDGKEKSIDALIEKESVAVSDRNDLSVYFNVAQLRIVYKDQLDAAEEGIDTELGQFQNIAPVAPGINLKPMLDMYSKFAHGMMQTVKDTQGFTLGISVAEESVDVETLARVTADSATDKILQANKKSDLKNLDGLPANSHVYVGASGNINGLVGIGTKMSAAMYTGEGETKEAFEKASKELSKLDFGSFLMSFGIGNADGGILRVANVINVKPTDKMRDLTREMVRSMGKMNVGPVKQSTELKADAEKYGDYVGDLVTTHQEVNPELDPLGIQTQMNRILYGEEGQVQRIVYLKDSVAQTMGGGRASMEQLLKSLAAADGKTDDTKTGNAAAATVRSKLSPEANLVAMVDLPSLVVDLLQAVIQASQLPIPIDADGLKKSIGEERSYVGLSFAGGPQSAHAKLHIPLLQARNVTTLVKIIQQMLAQPQF